MPTADLDVTLDHLWEQMLGYLQSQLSRPTYETWIKPARLESISDHSVVICTPNDFARRWLLKHYASVIAEVVQTVLGRPMEIQFSIAVSSDEPGETTVATLPSYPAAQGIGITSSIPMRVAELNPKYAFSRFVVGPNNRMAHAAALAVAEMPGRAYNPLFLCGGVGLGKTHLMQAIGQYRLDADPKTRISYVSTERFTNDLIDAIRRDSMQNFREHYRAVDVLLVDDIQFIEGKEYTQEEFFHTFNTLHESGKQIILAADRSPHLIPRLQERLCSRFTMGLIAEIQPPDIETRMAILKKKAEYEGMHLSPDVIEYIASTYTNNIRELEGALIRAVAFVSISGLPMTVTNIESVLSPPSEPKEITIDVVFQVITEEYGITKADLLSNSRKREISQARQMAMYLARHYTKLSLPKIGSAFGGKDHTTVLYSCDKVAQSVKEDLSFSRHVQQVVDRLKLAANQLSS
ncbi:MAG: chromosomal replication initiator protein DnaA [Synechococcales cyanobacterium]